MSDQATTHPLRVAFYARVAHDTDGAHARIAHQAARARAKIEHAPDWTLIESITDTGSGLRLQPGLRRLLNQARNGQFDLLLVERPRSLGRSTRLLATIFAELDRCAVILRTLDGTLDTATPAGQALARIWMALAEYGQAINHHCASSRRAARRDR